MIQKMKHYVKRIFKTVYLLQLDDWDDKYQTKTVLCSTNTNKILAYMDIMFLQKSQKTGVLKHQFFIYN